MRLPLGPAAWKHSGPVIQAGGRRTTTTGRHVSGASTLSSASVDRHRERYGRSDGEPASSTGQ